MSPSVTASTAWSSSSGIIMIGPLIFTAIYKPPDYPGW